MLYIGLFYACNYDIYLNNGLQYPCGELIASHLPIEEV